MKEDVSMPHRIRKNFRGWAKEVVALQKRLGTFRDDSPVPAGHIAAGYDPQREAEYLKSLWDLACRYKSIGQNDLAAKAFEGIIARTEDTQSLAACYLNLGQIAEQNQDYQAALDRYNKGLAFKPTDTSIAYFLNNNTGYCLNLFGKHTDAERYCRIAIEIDSQRNNAFKNLGIALQGQKNLVGAAWAYMEATKADGDIRTMPLLADLITSHPEIISQFSGILEELDKCKRAIESALPNACRELCDAHEVCKLKSIPGHGFFKLVDGVEREISPEEIHRLYTAEALRLIRNNPRIWCAILRERDTAGATDSGSVDTEKGRNSKSGESVLRWLRAVTPCLVLPASHGGYGRSGENA
ncbi:MAG: tetratricopeptide repeat protein [Gammaproteobacteria bacterium]